MVTTPLFDDELAAGSAAPDVDPDDYVEELTEGEGNYDPLPGEYVALLTGPKGGGKDLSLARILFRAMYYKIPCFTNIEFYPDKLRSLGIKDEFHPKPIELEWMLHFDEQLVKGVIAISELDTWIIKMKSNSNLNILISSFIKQIRKKDLRVFGSLHRDDSIPGEVQKEVDLLIQCTDSFYTEWGKEMMIPRGKMIFQEHFDYSGVITGRRGSHIGSWYIAHAEGLWDVYNSYQTYDPFIGFQKVGFEGHEITMDLSGQKKDTILSLWKSHLIALVVMYPKEVQASLRDDGMNTWLVFNPVKAANIASKNDNYEQVCDDLESIRGMRAKPFVKARRDGKGKMELQALPDMVPQLKEIIEGSGRGNAEGEEDEP